MGSGNGKIGQPRGGTRGVAAYELRRHNLGAILEHVHLRGPVSRSHLTAATGLNRSTVADLVGELVELRLVSEGPATVATGPGRPSHLVDVQPHGAVVLAVEIFVDSLAVATVGIGGHVFSQIRVARQRGHFSPDRMVGDIVQLAAPLLGGLPANHRLVGVGVAIVGITRRDDGFVHLAPNLGWKDVPLGEMLVSELDIPGPVLVANDADLGALGEFRRGSQDGVDHLVYISGEVGIGCGFVVDGEPLLGAAGYAGEAGHALVNPGGRDCGCGATGCWETEAGEDAILRRVGLAERASGLEALDLVEQKAQAGDAVTLEALAETGHWLGLGIRNLINIFNPRVVVLGGLYHRFFEFIEETVGRSAATALQASRQLATIKRSSMGADASLIGAAELVLAAVIEDPAALSDH